MLGMCLNKRVLAGLAVVGVAVLVVAPNLLTTVLPLLLVAICPLSMLFMAKGMMGGGERAALGQQAATLGVAAAYACPMHPGVTAAGPGRCAACGMALMPASAPPPIDVPDRTGSALGPGEEIALLRLQLARVGEQQTAIMQQLAHLERPEISLPSTTGEHEIDQSGRATALVG